MNMLVVAATLVGVAFGWVTSERAGSDAPVIVGLGMAWGVLLAAAAVTAT